MPEIPLRLGVLCCSTMEAEVRAAVARLGVEALDVEVFSSGCCKGCKPTPGPAGALRMLLDRVEQVLTVCLACAPALATEHPDAQRIYPLLLETQAEAFIGRDAARRALDERVFLTLPAWVREWRRVVQDQWGFDQETARDFFAQSTCRILLLDTGVMPVEDAELEQMGDWLDLPVERRYVGVSHLEALLDSAFRTIRSRRAQQALARELAQVRVTAAGHAAIVDFVTALAAVPREEEVLANLRRLAEMLFGSSEVRFLPPGETPAPAASPEPDGFTVPIAYAGEALGSLHVADLATPDHLAQYRNVARGLADASAIAIKASRLIDRERSLAEQLAVKVDELDRFASVTAHDLKQPLQAAVGCVDLVRYAGDGGVSPVQEEYLQKAERALDGMNGLIEELLTLSRVGRREGDLVDLDLGELVDAVVEELAPVIQARGALLVRGPLPRVRGIRRWVHEVLRNLLGNALKYTPAPQPRIEIGGERAPGEPGMIQVHVRDDGVGIPPAELERVFDAFRRVDNRLAVEGTGLGLAIVKRAVEAHGGRVWIYSRVGLGSTFYFTLPAA